MSNNKVFIQANNKQLIGAKLAKFAIESLSKNNIEVQIINCDEDPVYNSLDGKFYLRKGIKTRWDKNDLQSFTLTRFFPPEIVNFEGKALIIDPDVFAVKDISSIFEMDMNGKAIMAKKVFDGNNSYWASSVMLLDCKKLLHWNKKDILDGLFVKNIDYRDLVSLFLENQNSIGELEESWNHYDKLNSDTYFLHNTNRLTQPWKTGLEVDFFYENKSGSKIFYKLKKMIKYLIGLLTLNNRSKVYYEEHPDKNQIKFFVDLCKNAISKDVINLEYINYCIKNKYVRADFIQLVYGKESK